MGPHLRLSREDHRSAAGADRWPAVSRAGLAAGYNADTRRTWLFRDRGSGTGDSRDDRVAARESEHDNKCEEVRLRSRGSAAEEFIVTWASGPCEQSARRGVSQSRL